jgi:hypothetical protein
MRIFLWLLVAIATLAFAPPTMAAEVDGLSGTVLKLAEKTPLERPLSVNVGGLVIAVVRDSGSRPPQHVAVTASEKLRALGTVRGVQNDEGVALMGGGYTWHLFQPTAAGNATVQVAYTEYGKDGKRVQREYRLAIVAK